MKFALIPCAATEWRDEGRLLGRVELPSTAAGECQCVEWVGQLESQGITKIYHAPDELAHRTAQLLARRLLVPTKTVHSLAEVDVGLWAGLTDEILESRYGSAHHELSEAPLNVSPPEGENLSDAFARLKTFLRKQAKRDDAGTLGLVLRPISLAMARCMLEGREPADIWDLAQQTRAPVVVEMGKHAAGTVAQPPEGRA